MPKDIESHQRSFATASAARHRVPIARIGHCRLRKRIQGRTGSKQALTRENDRALVAVSSEGVGTHASQTRRRSCSPTGTPAFGTEYQEIATPQIIWLQWFQNPASSRKSPGLLQLPPLPPGAAQFLASRLETDGVESSMLALVATKYRSNLNQAFTGQA
jgi:hypothetical protein